MPTWGEILGELNRRRTPAGEPDFDSVRRDHLSALHRLTGRNTVIYYTAWLSNSTPAVSITLQDMQGMMEAFRELHGPRLDLILHSPGGSAEAVASIVRYMRRKFGDVRVFVPLAAMSAATMWALSANEIWMGKHSQLGPIDPQMLTPQGPLPARAIIEQFEMARDAVKEDPSLLAAWLPILQQYGPALLKQCERAEELARRLVREWLERYMFERDVDAATKAAHVSQFFSDAAVHRSHALGIDRDQAAAEGVLVRELESDQTIQDAVLTVHHAAMHTMESRGTTQVVKIVENHLGRAFVQIQSAQAIAIPVAVPAPAPVRQPTPQPEAKLKAPAPSPARRQPRARGKGRSSKRRHST